VIVTGFPAPAIALPYHHAFRLSHFVNTGKALASSFRKELSQECIDLTEHNNHISRKTLTIICHLDTIQKLKLIGLALFYLTNAAISPRG